MTVHRGLVVSPPLAGTADIALAGFQHQGSESGSQQQGMALRGGGTQHQEDAAVGPVRVERAGGSISSSNTVIMQSPM